jgi:hypothetical protein
MASSDTSSVPAIAAYTGHHTAGGDGMFGETNGSMPAAGVHGTSIGGLGVLGSSTRSNGVQGNCGDLNASGVYGENMSGGWGTAGRTNGSTRAGVFGHNIGQGPGVLGTGQPGVSGQSATGDGVFGETSGSMPVAGVHGASGGGRGVIGESTSAEGVLGVSQTAQGVFGTSVSGIGVQGSSSSGTGVTGISSSPTSFGTSGLNNAGPQAVGVHGTSAPGTGVKGETFDGTGVLGTCSGGDAAVAVCGIRIGTHGLAGRFDGDVQVNGNFSVTGTKSFVQAHPTDPKREIGYVALEGGEAGTYVRGSGQLQSGKAVLALPEHFRLVTESSGLTVQLTPRGEWLQLYVVELDTAQLIVREAQGKSGAFDYLIQGVRRGSEQHEVIRTKR